MVYFKRGNLVENLFLIALAVFAGCAGTGEADIHYVAMGASDTIGVGADPLDEGYVFQIERRLEEEGKHTELTNTGIPAADVDLIKDTELKVAKLKDPDLITLFTGPNDVIAGAVPAEFEKKLGEILQDLRENTRAFIVIATIPDVTKAPRFQSEPDADVTVERVAQFNDAIVRQAGSFGISIADLRGIDVSQDVTSSDGYHPNAEGYTIIANKFLEVILPHYGL